MAPSLPLHSIVIAGLDPAIHPLELAIPWMDARVKPAHDEPKKRGGAFRVVAPG
jgi:hypothetical protein